MEPLGFGIVGCGGAALPVAEAMARSQYARLVRTYDTSQTLAVDLAARHGGSAAASLPELLADPGVQAVYIAVPHHLLHSLTRQVLESGRHALVEKPMALTLADVDDLIGLAAARERALGVFYELRHTAAHARARALIQSGAIGQVIGMRIQTLIDKSLSYWEVGYAGRSASPWRGRRQQAGGGVVLMNSSHQLDAFHYLTGLEAVSVSAETATLVAGVEVEDTAAAVIRYNNGALGSLIAGAHIAGAGSGHDETTDIYGTLGQIRLPDPYGNDPLQVWLKSGSRELEAGVWHSIPVEAVNTYAGAVDDFASAAARGSAAPTSGQDARRILQLVLALYEAAGEKKTVQIPQGAS